MFYDMTRLWLRPGKVQAEKKITLGLGFRKDQGLG